MEMKPAMVAIAAFVVVIVLAAVLMPILGDATKTEDTLTNKGYYRMSILSEEDSHTITWSYEEPTTITVDGTDVTLNPSLFPNGSSKSVVLSDSFLIRLFGHGTYYTVELWDKGYVDSVSSADSETLSISVSSGTLTWTANSETPVSRSYSDYVIAVDDDGNMIMKGADDKAYMLPDSELYAAGISTFGTAYFGGVYIQGTVESVTVEAPLTGVTVNDDIEIITTDVSSYVDLVSLEKITFSTTYDGTDIDQTYSYFVVPYQVTAEKTVHLSASENAILMVIPALLIIAILIGVLAVAMRGRE